MVLTGSRVAVALTVEHPAASSLPATRTTKHRPAGEAQEGVLASELTLLITVHYGSSYTKDLSYFRQDVSSDVVRGSAEDTPPLTWDPEVTDEYWRSAHKRLPEAKTVKVPADGVIGEVMKEVSYLCHAGTGRCLSPEATFQEEGVLDGDVLVAVIAFESHVLAMMMPARDPAEAMARMRADADRQPAESRWASDNPIERMSLSTVWGEPESETRQEAFLPGLYRTPAQNQPPQRRLWGALLYTDEDDALAQYVRRFFWNLDSLSGQVLGIFVVERPADWPEVSDYWRARLSPEQLQTWTAIGWLSTKPYAKDKVYDLAQWLGVPPSQLPCLVLFDDPSQPDKLTFPITSVTPGYFRALFTELRQVAEALDLGADTPVMALALPVPSGPSSGARERPSGRFQDAGTQHRGRARRCYLEFEGGRL